MLGWLEAVAASRSGVRALSALLFSSQAFRWSESLGLKEAQSFRLGSSGVLTYLTPDGHSTPPKSTQEQWRPDNSLSISSLPLGCSPGRIVLPACGTRRQQGNALQMLTLPCSGGGWGLVLTRGSTNHLLESLQ